MDTIIYFYRKRDLIKPAIETLQMKDYLLVRVGMNVGENKWFSHCIAPPAVSSGLVSSVPMWPEEQNTDELQPQHIFALLRRRLQEHGEKRKNARLFRQRQKFFREESALIRREMEMFLTELNSFVDYRYECRCVYGDAVRKGLLVPENYGESGLGDFARGTDGGREEAIPSYWLPQLWRQYWNIPEFEDYLQPDWMEPLLKNARLHHFVVLGRAECAPFAVTYCARRMKSLRWILLEKDCTEEFQDFVEQFYDDYGLAATLQSLDGENAFSRLLLVTREPVCVLDFTGEPCIPPGGVAQGSIWIDFLSVEEKARRIMERGKGVSYFSMKEIWKRVGKP